MKTHDLAKALNHLSRVLRAGPNVDFEDLTNLSTYLSTPRSQPQSRESTGRPQSPGRDIDDRGTGLALLAQMASYNKQELLELAENLGIVIEVRKADAVRDILGKILKSIQDSPSVRDRLAAGGAGAEPEKASSLARALAILMKQP